MLSSFSGAVLLSVLLLSSLIAASAADTCRTSTAPALPNAWLDQSLEVGVGARAEYACDMGFASSGGAVDPFSTCLTGGRWSAVTHTCVRTLYIHMLSVHYCKQILECAFIVESYPTINVLSALCSDSGLLQRGHRAAPAECERAEPTYNN